MDVSIIIVNYNSAELTINCIDSIMKQTYDIKYEIIVVDNNSKDDSLRKINNMFGSSIILIESKTNLGFGNANNLAAVKANGKYLFFLNPDTVLINNAIWILWRYLEENKRAGIAGGNLYSLKREPRPSYCERFDDLKTEKNSASWCYILYKKIIEKTFRYLPCKNISYRKSFNYSKKTKKVAYIFGSDLMISKKLFKRAGGFDKDIFMYSEEQELAWNVQQLGYQSVSIPWAKIIHLEGETSKDNGVFNEKYYRLRLNGIMIYFYKRFGEKGFHRFYSLRMKRYKKLMWIYKKHHGNVKSSVVYRQFKCLEEEYFRICTSINNKEYNQIVRSD